MATPPKPIPIKSAKIKPAKGKPPEDLNTKGKIVPKTSPAPKGKPTNPTRPDVANTHEYLDSVKKQDIPSEMGRLSKELSTAQADKNYVRATQLKDAKAGLVDKANAAGMKPSDFPTGSLSISIETAQALGAASGSLEGALEKRAYNKAMAQMAAMAKKAKTNGGGYSLGKKNVETGRCAEWLAKRDYEVKGYETMQFQNASGQGVDLIARKDGVITHVEVKGTTTDKAPGLSGKGKMGGEDFLADVKRRMAEGTDADQAKLKQLKQWEKDASGKPKHNKREVFVDDKGNGCMDKEGKPQQDKPWTPTKTRGPKK
jgi:hypothetical protein